GSCSGSCRHPARLDARFLLLAASERDRRVDEADVGERLREVAELLAGLGIDLLGEEAEVVGAREHRSDGALGLLGAAAAEREIFRRPEAADAERAFARRLGVAVAIEEP